MELGSCKFVGRIPTGFPSLEKNPLGMWVPKLDFRWILLGRPPQLWVVFVGYPFKRRWQHVNSDANHFYRFSYVRRNASLKPRHGWRQQNHRFTEAMSRVKEAEPPFLLSKAAGILAWPNWRCKGWKRRDFCSFDSFPGWRCHQDYQGTVFFILFWIQGAVKLGPTASPYRS